MSRAHAIHQARRVVPLVLLAALFALAFRVALAARLEPADFVFNNGAEVTSLDPATVTGVPEGRMIRALYESLCVKHPETLEALPGMAERWDVSDDGLAYTFHLREGARWTNGAPVTAFDFEKSYRRFLDPRTAAEYAYQLYCVKGGRAYNTEADADGAPANDWSTVAIRAEDERTLRFELENATPYFLDLVAFYPLFPVHVDSIEAAKERWPDTWQIELMKPEHLVTNGPYKLLERRINDRIRLVKNPDYWDADNVAFDTVDVLAVENYNTMLNLYLTGEVDWIDRVATNVVPRLTGREDFAPVPYLGSYFYRVNVTEPPFDDVRVRRALALTIDRKAICEKIMKKGEAPAFGLVPPMRGYALVEMEHGADFEADCARAKELLAEAGYGPGGKDFPTFEIHYNTSEAHRDIAEVVADGWKRLLGLDAKLLNQEWKVYLDTQRNLGYSVSRSAWIGDYVDPNTFLDMWVTGGPNNKTGWSSAEYDALIREAPRIKGAAERLERLAEAEAILLEELPILPIYYYVTQNVVNPRLGGFHANLKDEHFPKFWYWMNDEELAAKRAAYPADLELVDAPGPRAGKYSPAQERARASD